MFNTPSGLNLAIWGTSDMFPRDIAQNGLFPILPGYSYLDYLVFVGYFVYSLIAVGGGMDFGALFKLILMFSLNIVPIILSFIAAILLIIALIVNVVNLASRKLPKYIEKSRKDDKYKDPLNTMGLIIATLILFMGALFIPVAISLIPFDMSSFLVLDDALGRSVLMLPLLILFATFGLVIIIAIVKAVLRGKVNPK